jgi:hypothetical protein
VKAGVEAVGLRPQPGRAFSSPFDLLKTGFALPPDGLRNRSAALCEKMLSYGIYPMPCRMWLFRFVFYRSVILARPRARIS